MGWGCSGNSSKRSYRFKKDPYKYPDEKSKSSTITYQYSNIRILHNHKPQLRLQSQTQQSSVNNMCCKNKQARRAYKQARREARCAARYNRPVRPIVVYERKPGLIRMIVEHFLQSRREKRGLVEQDPAYEPMPNPQTRGAVDEEEYRDVEKVQVENQMWQQERSESMVELPSYGQAMKQN